MILASDQQGSEEVADTQCHATRLAVVLARDFGFADADDTVDEGTLAQTLSIGQTDTVFSILELMVMEMLRNRK